MNRLAWRLIPLLMAMYSSLALGYANEAVLGQQVVSEGAYLKLKEIEPALLDLMSSNPQVDKTVLIYRARKALTQLSAFTNVLEEGNFEPVAVKSAVSETTVPESRVAEPAVPESMVSESSVSDQPLEQEVVPAQKTTVLPAPEVPAMPEPPKAPPF